MHRACVYSRWVEVNDMDIVKLITDGQEETRKRNSPYWNLLERQ
jgi:hypothetical protein